MDITNLLSKVKGYKPEVILGFNNNYNTRSRPITGITIHSCGLRIQDGQEIFTAMDFIRKVGYSYHNLVNPHTGIVYRTVDWKDRAWHSGKSMFNGESDLNSSHIGLCMMIDHQPLGYENYLQATNDPRNFTDFHYLSIGWLCFKAMQEYPKISFETIVRHSTIASPVIRGNKAKPDPGTGFIMYRLFEVIREFKKQSVILNTATI